MTKRAAIYSRVSTAEQAEDDKTSLAEQERLCREYCHEKGYDVLNSYQDIASGTTKKRQSFMDMLNDAKHKQFDVIIAWKTDRLARGIYPCSALMEAIEESEVTIETVASLLTAPPLKSGQSSAVSKWKTSSRGRPWAGKAT